MGVPRLYQAQTIDALVRASIELRGETLTVMYPRQAGKNEVSAMFVGALLQTNAHSGGSVVVCAPTHMPQARISLERTRRYLALIGREGPPPPAGGGSTIAVGRATVTFLSASRDANVAGHTASLALIADEAQDIDAEWFGRQFRPMAASTGANTFLFGTAWTGHSLLEVAADRNRARDRKRRRGPRLHHQVSWKEVGEANRAYHAYVEAERERLGPEHPLFLTQYELVPVRSEGMLLNEAQLVAFEGDHPRQRSPLAGERYVAGLDLGGDSATADATVLVVGRLADGVCEVVDIRSWQGAPFGVVQAEIRAACDGWGLEKLAVDATGLGKPLAAELREALGRRVEPVTVTAALKAELGYALMAAANTGKLRLFAHDKSPEATAMWRELRTCRAEVLAGGRLTWGNAAANDDHVFALALCLQASAMAGQPRVASGRRRDEG